MLQVVTKCLGKEVQVGLGVTCLVVMEEVAQRMRGGPTEFAEFKHDKSVSHVVTNGWSAWKASGTYNRQPKMWRKAAFFVKA